MSVLTVGLSHRSAPLDVLEHAVVSGEDTGKVLDELLRCDNVSEAMLLSTCNRVEVYAVVQTFHGGLDDVTRVLTRQAGVAFQELAPYLYVHYAEAAVEHMFTVAAGLDSMVVGEPQILGQVRGAYAAAEQAATVGSTLHELAQQALRVGKRVQHDTGIDAAGASVVTEVLTDASDALDGLGGRRAVVIGAGSMGALVASGLRRMDVGEIVVVNRTVEAAARLAETCHAEGTPARAVGIGELNDALAGADLVVSCTGAMGTVLDATVVRAAGRPGLVVCDLGLPRDVDPEVGELTGVTLIDLVSLQQRLADPGSEHGSDTTAQATTIVADEVRAYLAAQRSAEVTPTVTALRRRAAEVAQSELLRLDGKLPDLDPAVRDELARTVRRVVDKLLHTPTVRVKELATSDDGHAYADALRELFGLDPQAPEALTRAKEGEQ